MTIEESGRLTCDGLSILELRCPNCNGGIVVDTKDEKQRSRFRTSESRDSLICPLCSKPYDVAYRMAIESFWEFRERALKLDTPITFRIRVS